MSWVSGPTTRCSSALACRRATASSRARSASSRRTRGKASTPRSRRRTPGDRTFLVHLRTRRETTMRRMTLTFVMTIASLCLFPQRADAYFWEWLDSLSGPKFLGFMVEWRLQCWTDNFQENFVRATEAEVVARRQALEIARINPTAEAKINLLQGALDAAVSANALAKLATSSPMPPPDVSIGLAEAALAWERLARARTDAASDGQRAETARNELTRLADDARQKEDTARTALSASLVPYVLPAAGVIVSVCPAKTLDRRRASLELNISWGWDKKNSDNKMWMI